MEMSMKADRDIDKTYPLPDFVAKLRRLADALEAGEPFDIQIAGERIYVPSRAIFSIEHEREEGHEEIEFQLHWQHAEEADEARGTGEKSLAGDAAS
jgi:amphi-Trp domain-containing protein